MKKINIKKLISDIKKTSDMNEKLTSKMVHPAFRERDMRKESIDMGSHEAHLYLGE